MIRPAGLAGDWDVDVFGRGDGGDVITTFRWTTPVDGQMPPPASGSAAVLADHDGELDSYGVELGVNNLASRPGRATAAITVSGSDGQTTIEPRWVSACYSQGDLWFKAARSRGLAATEIGEGPFTYTVTLTLDGTTYTGVGEWPTAESPGIGTPRPAHLDARPPVVRRLNGETSGARCRNLSGSSSARIGTMSHDEGPRPVETWLTDMDGVLVHEDVPIEGATEFIEALKASGLRFLVLTNNSIFTPRDLRARLLASGIDVPEEAIWTSALATAQFLADQRPHGTAYVVGEAGLTNALHEIGYVMTDRDPDYVILGETRTYSFESITRAIRLIDAGARFIATNPDPSGPSHQGKLPATGSVAALISTATGRAPVLHRQAQPADDAQRPQPPRGALRDHRDGGRPDGDRHHQRPRGRLAHRAGHDGVDAPRRHRAVSPTDRPGSSTPSPTWSSTCDRSTPIRQRSSVTSPAQTRRRIGVTVTLRR